MWILKKNPAKDRVTVRTKGLEPSHPRALPPEDSASTNFATCAALFSVKEPGFIPSPLPLKGKCKANKIETFQTNCENKFFNYPSAWNTYRQLYPIGEILYRHTGENRHAKAQQGPD